MMHSKEHSGREAGRRDKIIENKVECGGLGETVDEDAILTAIFEGRSFDFRLT